MNYFLGIDVGGTFTRIGVVNEQMQLVDECKVLPSKEYVTASDPIKAMAQMIREYLEQLQQADPDQQLTVSAAAIGMPASVSNDFNRVYCAPNLKDRNGRGVFDQIALGEILTKELGIPVYVNKDVNFLLQYDVFQEQLKGIILGIYIGTGFGCAVKIGQEFLYGAHGYAMDFGHSAMFSDELVCGCGKRGCVETRASGHRLSQICAEYFPECEIGEIFAKKGEDPMITEFVRDCAFAAASLISVYDPDTVVLGGGILQMKEFPMELFRNNIDSFVQRGIAQEGIRYVYSGYQPERGVIGAALFAAAIY